MIKRLVLVLALLPLKSYADESYSLETYSLTKKNFDCMVLNSYFEARNQSKNGLMSVTHTVLNRIFSTKYPNTACEVIEQAKRSSNGAIIRHRCQFSWFCDGLSDKPRDQYAYDHAIVTTRRALELWEYGYDITLGSTHYHAKTVTPYWSKSLEYRTTIDGHHFYR